MLTVASKAYCCEQTDGRFKSGIAPHPLSHTYKHPAIHRMILRIEKHQVEYSW